MFFIVGARTHEKKPNFIVLAPPTKNPGSATWDIKGTQSVKFLEHRI